MTTYPGPENALIVVASTLISFININRKCTDCGDINMYKTLTCIRLPVLREKRLFKQNCLLFHYWKVFNQRCRHSTRSGKLSLTEGLTHTCIITFFIMQIKK